MATRRLEALPQLTDIDLTGKINEVYKPYLMTVNNYEIYYGGNGSGKSSFIGQKLALQMTIYDGRNLVCIRKQKKDCVKSCWGEIYTSLKRFKLLKYWEIKKNPEHLMINRINGNQILFEGLDDIEDIKSIKFANEVNEDAEEGSNITDVWYEETNAENDQNNVDELDGRIRDPYIKGRLILSFNPVSRTHWLFEYVTVNMQMAGVDSIVLKTTHEHNRFLPEDQREKLKRYQYTNPYRYQVYCLGNWGTTGQTVFDPNKIQKRLDELAVKYAKEPYIIGQFDYQTDANGMPLPDTFMFFETPKGKISIYEMPQPRVPYVLAVDTAGDGSDFYVGQMRNNITGAQVAVFRDDKTPDMCVWQLYGLAKMYNDPLVGPEVNFDSWIIKAFQLLGYDNFYRRTTAADRTTPKTERKYGWRTGPENRQLMLTEFVHWTQTNMNLINDVETLNEMLLFTVQEKKMKGIWWGAEPGAHDDLVMAFAILLQICSQQLCEMTAEIEKVTGYWTQGELNIAVRDGRIEETAAKEYMKNHPERFKRYKQGVSRYAR